MKSMEYTASALVTCSKCGASKRVQVYEWSKSEPLPDGWRVDKSNRLFKKVICKECSEKRR